MKLYQYVNISFLCINISNLYIKLYIKEIKNKNKIKRDKIR